MRESTAAPRGGVSRGIHTGDTILGIRDARVQKPAARSPWRTHLRSSVSKHQATWKDRLGAFYGDLVHEGLYFDPITKDVEAFLASSQRAVNGTVTVRVVRGRVEVVSIDTDASLMGRPGAVYGEGSKAWTGEEARAFTKIYGIPQTLAARRDAAIEAKKTGAK